MKEIENSLDRFKAKCQTPFDSTCIEWIGALSVGGYGVFTIKTRSNLWRNVYAHRFAYETYVKEIPIGMYIDHICRNRKCVRPEHLRVVTPKENATENSTGIAARNKRKTHCKKGHEFTEENTLHISFPSQKRRQCRVCYETARKIRNASWRTKELIIYGAKEMSVA